MVRRPGETDEELRKRHVMTAGPLPLLEILESDKNLYISFYKDTNT